MKASVVIPAYNSEKTIGSCLESVLSQKVEGGFEVIVVNDGSGDRTAEVVKRFPVKLISQKNQGPAAARNNGVRNAKGEIVAFIDADCTASGNWLSELLKPFDEKDVVGVQGAYKTKQREFMARFAQLEIDERYERMRKAKNLDWVGSYSAAYRREIFSGGACYDESFPTASGEDPELSFRLAERGCRLVFQPGAVVYHRHPETLLKYLRSKFYRAYWRVSLYGKHKGKIIRDSYTPQVLKLQIALFYLFFATLVGGFFCPPLFFASVFIWGVGLATTLHFSIFVLERDLPVALAAPFIIMFRSAVFGAGLMAGAIKGAGKGAGKK